MIQLSIDFRGSTYDPRQDHKRLARQLESVKAYMLQGGRYTLQQISEATGSPQASVSARYRDLKRLGYSMKKERVPGERGLWLYWMEISHG